MELQKAGSLLVEDGNHGEYRPRRHEFTETGTAFVRAADMRDGRVLFESASRINDAALERIRKGVGQPGDAILSHKGTVGKVAWAPLDCPPFVCSPQTTFWRALPGGEMDARYLVYFLQSPFLRRQLRARENETDMAAYVSLTNQRALSVLVPPLSDQQRIAIVLGALDDKIELNRRMNATLEVMAQAIFKSWFINFDGHNDLVDSELGMIPKGWRTGPISEVITIVGGGTPKRSEDRYWGDGIPWFSVKDAPSSADLFVVQTECQITEAGLHESSAKLVPPRTTIISARGTVGRLALTAVPMAFNQSCYGIRPIEGYGELFVHFALRAVVEQLRQAAHGSVFDTITRKTFDVSRLVIPPPQVTGRYESACGPLADRILLNVEDCRTLAALRDALLPKLLSGEIRIPDAEKEVEAAV